MRAWHRSLRALRRGVLALCLAGAPACADDGQPRENTRTLLRVALPGDAAPRHLTRADLHALPTRSFRTTTNWTDGPQRFTGVPLRALLEDLGVGPEATIALRALNGYRVEAPANALTRDGALIAYLRNGTPMTPREKGPLWLVFDYDSDPALRTETVYSRSIWQLDAMTVSR
ncbi:molybdopterin-dependent oxidoreductase [Roseovarius salinarum]|uniref:molybdopterin-dependent oxidoreductase n=1 Tax=Roseovarius salinarum TaxID=1981892 RepID=UPI001E581163|nr:molybdopterin-dependent oxidoreductase [Roseovarius salinarum]